MNRQRLTKVLLGKGFSPLGRGFFAKLQRKGNWYFGTGVLVTSDGVMQFKCAEHVPDSVPEAVAVHVPAVTKAAAVSGLADDFDELEVGAFGDRLRRRSRGFRKAVKGLGKSFRRKVNKTAKAIARAKVVKTLQRAKMKALQSPIADAAMGAGAAALSAFGIPPNVAKAAMQHARDVQVDRLKHGGWAGMTARATGPGGLRGVIREGAQRHARAGRRAMGSLVPGVQAQAQDSAEAALRRAFKGAW
jgi:hypothetical protein